jgi:transcriptional regulator with XRE-family HTH domain
MSSTPQNPGALIRRARIERGMSQAELAKLAGVPYSTLRALERGGPRGPQMATLRKLATALGVSIVDLAA